jgi:ribosome biogenesis GTPase
VVRTSCKGDPGIGALADRLTGRTSILVGQSGVGKSSLANRLLPDLDLQTGDLSRATGKGTHTTTTTMMHALPCGGWLIDSPGVWEYGLWRLDAGELIRGFPDLSGKAAGCRFHNCLHAHEPGCAVREAAEQGAVFDWRYQAYRRLLEQGERA